MPGNMLGTDRTEKHFITHMEWNSMPEMFSRGSNETGIRDIKDGEIVLDSFRLIQHGWHSWQDANDFIKKALAKGWDAYRIDKSMEFLKGRGK